MMKGLNMVGSTYKVEKEISWKIVIANKLTNLKKNENIRWHI